ncbi:hypothetical protein Droror1_Dr00027472 [Drosera rotundifolia]
MDMRTLTSVGETLGLGHGFLKKEGSFMALFPFATFSMRSLHTPFWDLGHPREKRRRGRSGKGKTREVVWALGFIWDHLREKKDNMGLGPLEQNGGLGLTLGIGPAAAGGEWNTRGILDLMVFSGPRRQGNEKGPLGRMEEGRAMGNGKPYWAQGGCKGRNWAYETLGLGCSLEGRRVKGLGPV